MRSQLHTQSRNPEKSTDRREMRSDSLDTVQLLFDAEDTFDVSFDGEEIKGPRRVGILLTILVGIRRWVRC